jgi:hypothetical protein
MPSVKGCRKQDYTVPIVVGPPATRQRPLNADQRRIFRYSEVSPKRRRGNNDFHDCQPQHKELFDD